MREIVGIFREPEFSPGREADDTAILEAVTAGLAMRGFAVRLGDLAVLEECDPTAILAMCQSERALATLERWSAAVPIINAPAAIRHCYRTETVRLLGAADVAFPATRVVPTDRTSHAAGVEHAPELASPLPCWVKRGDVHATAAGDVTFVATGAELQAALAALAARGIARAALQAHVEGALVKYYGVADGRFFRAYRVGEGLPPAALPALWDAARRAATALGLEVFGGDMVVTSAGEPIVVDVNDWPSFARCRDEAAVAIAGYVEDLLVARGVATGPTTSHDTRAGVVER